MKTSQQGRGGKVAIYYQDQKITYQEVFENVNRTGNALKDLGIEIENRVLVILPDSPEFAYSFFGAIKIGAVAVPTNPWMFAKDYEYLINDSRARAIIVHESTLPEIEKIWDHTPFLKHVIVVGTPKGKALVLREFDRQSVGQTRCRENLEGRCLLLGLHLRQHRQPEGRGASAA